MEDIMLYSNKKMEATERNMDFGTIYQVGMGEVGRGRKFMALTCPKGTVLKEGMNPDFTIGTTKSGKPRINKRDDNTLYMMLSSKGGYTRRGNGTIKVLASRKERFEIISLGNGADGDAGRIGYWDCILLKAPNTDAIVRVRTSGSGYGTPSDLYVIHKGEVYHCYISELEECCEALGIEVPCKLVNNYGELQFGDDWITL